jgi:hypothetical protein
MAEPLIDRGATLDEVEARIGLVEDLRLSTPELAGELDEIIQSFALYGAATTAREAVRVAAKIVTDTRAGRRPRPSEEVTRS